VNLIGELKMNMNMMEKRNNAAARNAWLLFSVASFF